MYCSKQKNQAIKRMLVLYQVFSAKELVFILNKPYIILVVLMVNRLGWCGSM